MTNDELASLAIKFDGGICPVINGIYVTSEHISYWRDSYNHHDFISLRHNADDGSRRWAVERGGSQCLNKKGQWEYEGMQSSRTDKFIARCRFDTIEEAFAALRKVHDKERQEWIKKVGRGVVPQNMAEEKALNEAYKLRVRARAEARAEKAANSALQHEKKR